jgi:hypothetical protein
LSTNQRRDTVQTPPVTRIWAVSSQASQSVEPMISQLFSCHLICRKPQLTTELPLLHDPFPASHNNVNQRFQSPLPSGQPKANLIDGRDWAGISRTCGSCLWPWHVAATCRSSLRTYHFSDCQRLLVTSQSLMITIAQCEANASNTARMHILFSASSIRMPVFLISLWRRLLTSRLFEPLPPCSWHRKEENPSSRRQSAPRQRHCRRVSRCRECD